MFSGSDFLFGVTLRRLLWLSFPPHCILFSFVVQRGFGDQAHEDIQQKEAIGAPWDPEFFLSGVRGVGFRRGTSGYDDGRRDLVN